MKREKVIGRIVKRKGVSIQRTINTDKTRVKESRLPSRSRWSTALQAYSRRFQLMTMVRSPLAAHPSKVETSTKFWISIIVRRRVLKRHLQMLYFPPISGALTVSFKRRQYLVSFDGRWDN